MNWREYKKKLLRDPEFAREYGDLAPEYELARSLIELRIRRGLTQEKLAQRAGTKQSGIARLESGHSKPSVRFLQRLAEALDAELVIRFEPKQKRARKAAS